MWFPASGVAIGARNGSIEMTDAILDPLINFCVDVIGAIGYAGIFVLMLLESACIPIPSEATMLFGGFKVSDGSLTLAGITAAGVIGNLVGSWAAYAVGYFGRVELLERNRLFHVSPKHLATADRWFDRHGEAAVFFTRLLPIVRTFISLPAGVARMPFWRFTVFTVLGCIPWVLALGWMGTIAGENWREWKDYLHYFDYVVAAAIIGGAGWFVVKWFQRRKDRQGSGKATPADPES